MREIASRHYIGYDLDEFLPDHSAISRDRSPFGQELDLTKPDPRQGVLELEQPPSPDPEPDSNPSDVIVLSAVPGVSQKPPPGRTSNELYYGKTDPEAAVVNPRGKPGGNDRAEVRYAAKLVARELHGGGKMYGPRHLEAAYCSLSLAMLEFRQSHIIGGLRLWRRKEEV